MSSESSNNSFSNNSFGDGFAALETSLTAHPYHSRVCERVQTKIAEVRGLIIAISAARVFGTSGKCVGYMTLRTNYDDWIQATVFSSNLQTLHACLKDIHIGDVVTLMNFGLRRKEQSKAKWEAPTPSSSKLSGNAKSACIKKDLSDSAATLKATLERAPLPPVPGVNDITINSLLSNSSSKNTDNNQFMSLTCVLYSIGQVREITSNKGKLKLRHLRVIDNSCYDTLQVNLWNDDVYRADAWTASTQDSANNSVLMLHGIEIKVDPFTNEMTALVTKLFTVIIVNPDHPQAEELWKYTQRTDVTETLRTTEEKRTREVPLEKNKYYQCYSIEELQKLGSPVPPDTPMYAVVLGMFVFFSIQEGCGRTIVRARIGDATGELERDAILSKEVVFALFGDDILAKHTSKHMFSERRFLVKLMPPKLEEQMEIKWKEIIIEGAESINFTE